MKIIQLQSENFKRLRAVRITPKGSIVEITGKNGAGKTSTLDAIWVALAGMGVAPKKPIRTGEDKATITLKLGDGAEVALKVTRTFRAQDDGSFTHSIKVENGEGATYSSPQKMLNELIGSLSFDPLAFTRMKPADQFDALKRFVTGVDMAEIDELNAADFAKRTDHNRRAKELRARAEGLAGTDGMEKPADVADLMRQFGDAGDANAKIAQKAENRRQLAEGAATRRADAASLRQQIAQLRNQMTAMESSAELHEAEAADIEAELAEAKPLPEPVDLTDLRRRIEDARAASERWAVAAAAEAERARVEEQAAEAEAASAALTKAMDQRQKQKAKAIAEAKMPVAGLGFGQGEITLNGVPFDQASAAEKLRASVGIAASMNPKLRVIRVADGALLDDDSWASLGQMAEELGCQVWVETVESGRPAAIVIEDGSVKEKT